MISSGVILMCYGCANYDASQCKCVHPNTDAIVQWDVVRNYTYRYPSVDQCIRAGGLCSKECFRPDPGRSTLYSDPE